jgi:hypothetical protein
MIFINYFSSLVYDQPINTLNKLNSYDYSKIDLNLLFI